MLVTHETRELLNKFFQKIRLNISQQASKDKHAKIGQIVAYLEVLHAQIRKYSKKRELVFIDCAVGNCYLSFLVYYFYKEIDKREIRIHCLDNNHRLVEKNKQLAENFGFDKMFFHGCDIADYVPDYRPDLVYSLHACDSATDKTLHLGLRSNARNILSVSCCQHMLMRTMKSSPFTGITKNQVFKRKLAYMIGDSMRALLLEMQGYIVDVVEFASSRHTDKNIMLRARIGQIRDRASLNDEYYLLQNTFKLKPLLEDYLSQEENNSFPSYADKNTCETAIGDLIGYCN